VKVLLVAEEAIGVHVLRLLAEREDEIVAVLSAPAPERGASVAGLAAELEVPRLDPKSVRDAGFAGWIAEQEIDLLLNVHSLHLIDATVLDAPRIGSFNLHPGPLPGYAGLNAPSWAIAEGETRHAVTLHWMTADVDAGSIAYKAWFEIGPRDTGVRVATRGAQEGVPLLRQLLEDAAAGSIPAIPQPPGEKSVWHGREVPYDGVLPWSLGARRVVDLVRAADFAPFESPWGFFRTTVGDQEVAILRASATGEPTDAPAGTVGKAGEKGVAVSAGDEWVEVERTATGGESRPPAEVLPEGAVCEARR
jgi:UDP-4-amino-4-deoxy-L-arabinose formyltransferase/UDP-glucuronic acid dehydrogenase (UDP-4-keto-hexauronic acid decarboxylating)